jgi:hypothetical protein
MVGVKREEKKVRPDRFAEPVRSAHFFIERVKREDGRESSRRHNSFVGFPTFQLLPISRLLQRE